MMYLVSLMFICALVYGQDQLPQLDGKIIGGQQAYISDFPYLVSVRILDQHICGGTIINAKTILTAAHCVDGMDHSQFSVRVGNTRHAFGTSYRVNKVIKNIYYNQYTYDNDMAILKLLTPVIFSKTVQPVKLQPQGTNIPVGTTAWVSGWGVTQEGSHGVLSSLRAVDVAVISNNKCRNNYGNVITSHMMCAQTLYHDSCQGDSGGPLVANGRLIGVVSWGYGCARPDYPGIYAKVSDMYGWIEANTY